MKIKGLSVCFTIGKWGGFYLGIERICIGWVSVFWLPLDIEVLLDELTTAEHKPTGAKR